MSAPLRVLHMPVFGPPSTLEVSGSPASLERLVGGPLRPLPVGASERLALYVRDDDTGAPINLRASRAFGEAIRGDVVLAALRPLGTLDDLRDDEVMAWSARAMAPSDP